MNRIIFLFLFWALSADISLAQEGEGAPASTEGAKATKPVKDEKASAQ